MYYNNVLKTRPVVFIKIICSFFGDEAIMSYIILFFEL